MENEFPFLLILQSALTANGTGTMSYSVPPAEDLYIYEWYFTGTGAFSITNVRNSNGRIYSNTSSAIAIPSTMLAMGNTTVQRFNQLVAPLKISGSEQLLIDIIDTSGSGNTVRMLANTKRLVRG